MKISLEKEFKIIIVTENVHYRNNLASALRLQGYAVEFCSGGFHVLSYLEQHQDVSCLIIQDNMEDMSAVEIISLARVNKKRNELPILYILKKFDNEQVQEAIIAGANEHVIQGNGFQNIIDKVKKYYTQVKTN